MSAYPSHMKQYRRCLVIEDSLFDQKIIQRMVHNAQVDAIVEFTTTLGAARRALALNHFDMVLCDNNLPDGNGTEFAQQLAHDPRFFDTAIIIVSGWPSPFMWAKARDAGLQIIDKNDQMHQKLCSAFKKHLGETLDPYSHRPEFLN